MPQQLAENVNKLLLARLQAEFKGLAELYPVERYVSLINENQKLIGYRALGKRISNLCAQIVHDYSREALDLYHRIILIHLLIINQNKIKLGRYTDNVREQLQDEIRRIIQDVEQNPIGFYDYENDLFCKDIGVAALRMFPAEALKVQSLAGIPRSILFSNNGKDVLKCFWLISKFRGFNPVYEIHLDIRYRGRFNPEGWDTALRLIGEMLRLHPNIKGISGASWFFDPQIWVISPHLIYLRKSIEENGGRFFFYKSDDHTTELATLSSPIRRKLYENGHYQPVSYFMLWHRTDILQWLELGAGLSHNS